jgi:hypothetical protein
VPVAIVALVLIPRAHIAEERRPARLDLRGAVLLCAGMGLVVLGLQQASVWGWDSAATWGCVAAGIALLAAFVVRSWREPEPLIRVRLFRDRGFAADNAILALMSVAFVPLFLVASLYAQICLGWKPSEAGLYPLIFCGGFATAAQVGGRILDSRGARPSVVVGCAVAVGFAGWAEQLPDQSLNGQWLWIIVAGAGMGLILGPASTDVVNRARTGYGEATGITQTARNFGSSPRGAPVDPHRAERVAHRDNAAEQGRPDGPGRGGGPQAPRVGRGRPGELRPARGDQRARRLRGRPAGLLAFSARRLPRHGRGLGGGVPRRPGGRAGRSRGGGGAGGGRGRRPGGLRRACGDLTPRPARAFDRA